MTIEKLTARAELKELVDNFSNYSDVKDARGLSELFTDDGVLEFQIGFDGVVQNITGRDNLLTAFKATLLPNKAIFHINGQHTVSMNDELTEAQRISYCQASFVTEEAHRELLTTNYIRYSDSYIRINEKWYIKSRRSTFLISEKRSLTI